jgi:adenosylhomocysteine nucleosidase
MIGITFALPSESSDLVRRLSNSRRDGNLVLGKIDNREMAIVHTGVGAKHCNERLEILLHKARPKFVISTGFAGAVNDQLRVGDLILGENFSDPQLLASVQRILRDAQPHTAKLFTSTSIIDSIPERNEIAGASGAAAVDMETGAIVAVCNAHGTPLLSLRAISDTPSQPFPVPPTVLFDIERQQTNYRRLFSHILREPASALRLFRFGREIARVRASLTKAIVALVKET